MTARSPDGSGETDPRIVRGAFSRLKRWPSRIPRMRATGAVLSGPAVTTGATGWPGAETATVSRAERTLPVFDAFNFVDDSQGGHLTPKPPGDRGKPGVLQTGMLHRCPGAAGASPDGSGPFVDGGPLANPDCDPAEAIGGGG